MIGGVTSDKGGARLLGRLFLRIIDAQAGWSRPFGDFNHRWLTALFRPLGPVKDLLHVPDQFALAAVVPIGKPVREITKLRRHPVAELATWESFDGEPL